MQKILVTFEVCVAEGRVPEPTKSNNYAMLIRDAIREDGVIVDTMLNESTIPGEYSKQPTIVLLDE